MPDPALMVGPQDPDNTAELTQRYGVGNNALLLLEGQEQNFPAELRAALALPIDAERSEALVDAEVYAAAGDLLRETKTIGDEERKPELVESYVRGSDDRSRVVTISYISPSGRSAKALLGPYVNRENPSKGFPQSQKAHDEVRRAKMGIAAAQSRLDRDEDPAPDSPEAEALREEVERLSKELASARDPEPFEGYVAENASNLRKRLADSDRDEAQRVLDYERAHEDRSTVTDAAVKRIDAIDEAEREQSDAQARENAELRERLAALEAKLADESG